MKVFVIRKNAIISVFILIFVIFVSLNTIFVPAIETFIDNHEKEALAKQTYKEYKVLDDKFSFKLPRDWTTWSESFEGGEIIYSLFFKSADSKLHGFIQVWNIKKPLEQFVNESKSAAVGAVDYKYYEISQIMVDRKVGYLMDYSRQNAEGNYYKGYEALIEGDNNKIYRASFFVEEKSWKDLYKMVFNTIIQSFKIKLQ